ncbi:recombinase family protein [Actinomadura kijaniata]|uniref:recombinase family protein n=1 Tax=Actinomadura kijaniata TaxID=46161 RepID=UPI003F1B0F8A
MASSHDQGGIVFTVLAAMSGMEREYLRDRTLEGQETARARGKTVGGAASPTSTCCRWRCTCATSPSAWSSPPAPRRANTPPQRP